jgi:hypothetical protein
MLSFPAQPAPDLIAVRWGSVRWKQSEKRHLVLVKCMIGLSHISSLCFLLASRDAPGSCSVRNSVIKNIEHISEYHLAVGANPELVNW